MEVEGPSGLKRRICPDALTGGSASAVSETEIVGEGRDARGISGGGEMKDTTMQGRGDGRKESVEGF